MPRPTKLKISVIHKLEEAFKLGFTVEQACIYAEISTSSYYDWRNTNTKFSDKMESVKMYLEFKSRCILAKSLEEGSIKTAMWYLERRRGGEFGNIGIETNTKKRSSSISDEERLLIRRTLVENDVIS